MTKHSELGHNDTIKTAGKAKVTSVGDTPESSRRARRREKLQAEQSGESAA